MIKCQADISSHAIIFSRYIKNPGEYNYKALEKLPQYLVSTKDEGVYYWYEQPHPLHYKKQEEQIVNIL
jgi:hypothetical protein